MWWGILLHLIPFKYLVLLLTALQIEYFKVTYKLFILDIYGVEYDDYKVFFENIFLHRARGPHSPNQQ